MTRRSVSHRRARRGFTLVELMVSLVAGLFIAMAVIALAKTATNTFHEQVRITTTEATLRTASERLRNDLLRVAFMGTGNATIDPTLANKNGTTLAARYPSMTYLQGIRIYAAASPGTSNAIMQLNGMQPDMIEMTGNLSTDDAYRMQWVVSGSCSGPRLQMLPDADAAILRLVGGAATTDAQRDALVKTAFVPKAGKKFWARAMDDRGCFHYVEICDAGYTAGTGLWVDISPPAGDNGILTPQDTQDNCGGNPLSTEFSVSPLNYVRWSVGPYPRSAPNATPIVDDTLDPQQAGADPELESKADKMYLYRDVLDTQGAPAIAPEIIAEYAADMKFGVIVWNKATNTPSIYDMDPPGTAAQTQSAPSNNINGATGPQRIRAVRYRLTVRSGIPERRTPMSIFTTATPSNQPYIVRYCYENKNPCTRYVRARSLVSEVTLTNQARFNY